jgi:hypothetical protein
MVSAFHTLGKLFDHLAPFTQCVRSVNMLPDLNLLQTKSKAELQQRKPAIKPAGFLSFKPLLFGKVRGCRSGKGRLPRLGEVKPLYSFPEQFSAIIITL